MALFNAECIDGDEPHGAEVGPRFVCFLPSAAADWAAAALAGSDSGLLGSRPACSGRFPSRHLVVAPLRQDNIAAASKVPRGITMNRAYSLLTVKAVDEDARIDHWHGHDADAGSVARRGRAARRAVQVADSVSVAA